MQPSKFAVVISI